MTPGTCRLLDYVRVGAILPGCVTRMHYITRSLRWVLTLYLCWRLARRLTCSRRSPSATTDTGGDMRNWRRDWPGVFADA